MADSAQILVGVNKDGESVNLQANRVNRHGLITGATGTGKTVTLQGLAEQFSSLGIPVFMADVKGDLAGLSQAGAAHPKVQERVEKMGLSNFSHRGYPVVLWDLFAERGLAIRTTVSEMGPVLLARLLDLNETQAGVLHIAFKMADEKGLLLLDLKDLRATLTWLADHASEVSASYGNVSRGSVGAIQRRLLVLGEAGGDQFFGEPALQLPHLLQSDFSGNGVVSVLDARRLMEDPSLYGTFLLWLLSELFENLEEVGDLPQPKLVFFFDEAHLLFKDAPKSLLDKIETVVRLIRSKGVGIFFVTQSPADIPEAVLGQLGNRIQHCLRAYTPADAKAVRVAAQAFPPNSKVDVESVITQLGTGESLVSVLDDSGAPTPVAHVLNAPPRSRMGPLTEEERAGLIARSPLAPVYQTSVDRESAYEMLAARAKEAVEKEESAEVSKAKKSNRQTPTEAFLTSMARSIGNALGKRLLRGILGSVKGR